MGGGKEKDRRSTPRGRFYRRNDIEGGRRRYQGGRFRPPRDR